jgi:hypothetical protein
MREQALSDVLHVGLRISKSSKKKLSTPTNKPQGVS